MKTVEDKIRDALISVIDPELGVSIVDLGLVYDVRFENGDAEIDLTLTSPGCPMAPIIDKKIREAVKEIKEVKKLRLELVWDPPWSPDLMNDELKASFGF